MRKINRKSIKVLEIMNNLENGGIESFCLNIHRNINREKYKIDYLLMMNKGDYYLKDIEAMGQKVIKIKDYNNKVHGLFKEYKAIKNVFIKNGPYDVIHIHQCRATISILLAAHSCKIPIKCIHSHNAFLPKSNNKFLNIKIKIYSWCRIILSKKLNTINLGCSKEACRAMFGNKIIKENEYKVIYDGIDLNKFNKSIYDKNIIAQRYDIDKEKINFINIGRFDKQKNHMFLLEVFSELSKINKDIKLTLIGYGELENEIKEAIKRLNLTDKVDMLPHDSNIPEILCTMDYFILPSLYEGLGIVLIEAQSMGIPCFVSNYIPGEAQLGLCNFISLDIGAAGWAEYINKYISNDIKQNIDTIKLQKYNIKNVVKEIEKIYEGEFV